LVPENCIDSISQAVEKHWLYLLHMLQLISQQAKKWETSTKGSQEREIAIYF
jgi:hypothetical protein